MALLYIAAVLAAGFMLWWVTSALYRVYFHPLSRYPGPVVAAVSSSWYEWYWNYRKHGEMIFELERLHTKYGPVVRIGPNDLSINDVSVYLETTQLASGFTKDPGFYRCISFPGTSIGEIDKELHRIRRKVLAPAFSIARVSELAPLIHARVEQLLVKFDTACKTDDVLNVTRAFHALTLDIISEIVLGTSTNCIEEPGFRHEFLDYLEASMGVGWVATAFPIMTTVALYMSSEMNIQVIPNHATQLTRQCLSITETYLEKRKNREMSSDSGLSSVRGKSTIIDSLLDPHSVKGHIVPSTKKLNDEIVTLLTAGNDTTSNAMLFGIYQICTNLEVHRKLTKELKSHFPSLQEVVTFERAKSLPYLTAIIKEILRLGSPLPGRLPRKVPSSGFMLYGHHLSPGVNLHMSPYLLNRHPDIWENATNFCPERWLSDSSQILEKSLATFNKGSRQCLGKDLAWCELTLLFANLFRRYDLELINPNIEWSDLILVNYKHDIHSKIHKKPF